MATVTNVNTTTPQQSTTTPNAMGSMDSDAFMQMLLAQLQYQDPTKPMDSSKMVSQMSDLTMIQSMSDMKNTITNLGNQLYSSQSLYASTLVGQNVSVLANVIDIKADETVNGKVLLPSPADDLKIEVRNDNGKVVSTLQLGKQSEAGEIDFDLKNLSSELPAGKYTLKAVSTTNNTETEAAITQNTTVTGVVIPGQGKEVLVEVDKVGLVPLSYITRLQGTANTATPAGASPAGAPDIKGQLNNFFNRELLERYPGLNESGLVDAGSNKTSPNTQTPGALPPSPAAMALATQQKATA